MKTTLLLCTKHGYTKGGTARMADFGIQANLDTVAKDID